MRVGEWDFDGLTDGDLSDLQGWKYRINDVIIRFVVHVALENVCRIYRYLLELNINCNFFFGHSLRNLKFN